jgi:hypothetical protein
MQSGNETTLSHSVCPWAGYKQDMHMRDSVADPDFEGANDESLQKCVVCAVMFVYVLETIASEISSISISYSIFVG